MARWCFGAVLGLLMLLSGGLAEAQWQAPGQQGQVAGPARRIHVNTTPPGMRAASSEQYRPVRTPHTFQIPAGSATAITIDGPGYERAIVPIPAGPHDLHLNVEMSRPVFEAGIALLSIGAALLITFVTVGAVWHQDADDDLIWCREWSSGADCDEEHQEQVGEAWFHSYMNWGLGETALTIAGVLMAALDRRHNPRYTWGDPATSGY